MDKIKISNLPKLEKVDKTKIQDEKDVNTNTISATLNSIKPNLSIVKPKFNIYENIVLSGGSTKGIAHIGALYELSRRGIIDFSKVKCYTCVSAGALVAFFFILGFEFRELWEFVLELEFKKLVNPDWSNIKKCGVDSGDRIKKYLEGVLEKKTGISNITFSQLYKQKPIKYNILGSCLTTKEQICFNHEVFPNMAVSDAIRISISLPFFFTPVEYEGNYYVDGGLSNNYPIDLHDHEQDKTLGLLIYDAYETKFQYPEQYPIAILNFFLHHYNKDRYKFRKNTVFIKGDINSYSSFNFDLTNEVKESMFQIGVQSVDEFIKTFVGTRSKIN
jgi:predicted patatin/cPLA2 family phospholipase